PAGLLPCFFRLIIGGRSVPSAGSPGRTPIGPPELPVAPREPGPGPSPTGGPRVRIRLPPPASLLRTTRPSVTGPMNDPLFYHRLAAGVDIASAREGAMQAAIASPTQRTLSVASGGRGAIWRRSSTRRRG